ncbi:MAG: hypothetical protein ACLRRK_06755 [Parasutterella sp.]
MNMNRRMFFKSMGAATVAAAPISSALANVVSPKKWDQTCEVLVIGAGAAGLLLPFRLKKAVLNRCSFRKSCQPVPELHIPFCRQRKRHRYKSSVCGRR